MMGRGFGYPGGGFGQGRGFGRGFASPGFFPGAGIAGFLLLAATLALVTVAFWQLYKKAGYEGGLGLLMLIPFVNVAAMLFLAFAEWPVLKELRECRAGATPTVAEAGASSPARERIEETGVTGTEPETEPESTEKPKE